MRTRLAIDGGAPAFAEPRHVGAPGIHNRARFHELLDGALDRRWLTNRGPLVERFEELLRSFTGVPHCVTVANATLGLELLLRALDLDGEVVVPSHTFVATAHAVRWLGLRPVFADVDPRTHTLDPASVAQVTTSATSAVLGVHLWGRPCDDDTLRSVAAEHDLRLVYDAAHAPGSLVHGRPVTALGEASVVSFHATKFLSAVEGGAVLTHDEALAERIRRMSTFGFTGRDRVEWLGTNAKMSEVHAAMGIAELEVVGDTVERNRERHARYAAGLAVVPGVRLLVDPPGVRSNAQYVVVEVDERRFGRTRDELVDALTVENVLARRYFWPGVHRLEPYRSEQPTAGLVLPRTERLAATVVALPTGAAMSLADVDTVCGLVERLHLPPAPPTRRPRADRSPLHATR